MRITITIFSLLLATHVSLAKSIIHNDVNDLKIFLKAIQNAPSQPEHTLVVFDIDDTLLEAKDFVGSDKWYNWQRGKTSYNTEGDSFTIKPDEKYLCLFSTLGTLFDLGESKLTQKDAVEVIDQLKPYSVMLLTSRSPNYRGATERELANNHIDLSSKHLIGEDNALSFDFNDGNRTAPVSYENAIAMSSGLDKGKVLQELLKRFNREYKEIFFIDDGMKNINNMDAAWKSSAIQVNSFHYTHVDKRVSQKEVENSNQVKQQLEQLMKTAFPNRFEEFSQNQCD